MRPFKRKASVVRNKAPPPQAPKFTLLFNEAGWFFLLGLTLFFALSLASYAPTDSAWSHSGSTPTRHNFGGVLGAWTGDLCLLLFGLSAWWSVGFLMLMLFWRYRSLPPLTWLSSLAWGLLLVSSMGLEFLRLTQHQPFPLPSMAGGLLGQLIGRLLAQGVGANTASVLLLIGMGTGFSRWVRFSWLHLAESLGGALEDSVLWCIHSWQARQDRAIGREAAQRRSELIDEEKKRFEDAPSLHIEPPMIDMLLMGTPTEDAPTAGKIAQTAKPALNTDDPPEASLTTEMPPPLPLPPLNLLFPPTQTLEIASTETLAFTSRHLERKLAELGFNVVVLAAYPGLMVTRYEFEPIGDAPLPDTLHLGKDLARALSMVSVRLIESIPGKTGCMGVELPNPTPQTVSPAELLGSEAYQNSASPLSLALGKTTTGKPIVVDLAKMPHLLLAGAPGTGKSTVLHGILLSLLYKATPRELRLILIDPQNATLFPYAHLPHLLCPIVSETKQALHTLQWCVTEMENRYALMAERGTRSLASYNEAVLAEVEANKPIGRVYPRPSSPPPPPPPVLVPIVVMVSELADLMMVASKESEDYITLLTQKARAAGIHLVLATHHPAVDVITGMIKANVPARIGLQVLNKIDSRTILDQGGAEVLLGGGDMLYKPPGIDHPLRLHGLFATAEEIQRVVDCVNATGAPDYEKALLKRNTPYRATPIQESDPLYQEALNIIRKTGKSTPTMLQRHLRIGHNRAIALLDRMEANGHLSAADGDGNQTVL